MTTDPETVADRLDDDSDADDGDAGLRMTEEGPQTVVIKPKSSVYHLAEETDYGVLTYCSHLGATKPGTTSKGAIVADLQSVVGDGFELCEECDRQEPPVTLTAYEERELLRKCADLPSRDGAVFKKSEVRQLTEQIADAETIKRCLQEVLIK
jgi:CheY-like chemotaxis protein